MNRMTTNTPDSNTLALLNFAYAVDREAKLRYAGGQEDVSLSEYASGLAFDKGCDVMPWDVTDGACMECDCHVSVLYTLGVQAAELRERLMAIEDILGDAYDLNNLLRMVEADKTERFLELPCRLGGTLYIIVTKRPKINMPEFSFVKQSQLTYNNMERVLRDFGKTVFLTREEAEAALEKMKEDHNGK